jgi:predicted ATPase with chaperone activity
MNTKTKGPIMTRTIEPFKLSNEDLHILLFRCNMEMRRRTLEQTAKHDPAVLIKGMEYQKRAIVVAATGSHSICFVGCQGTGKTMLRAMALRLGVYQTFELWPCPCGNLGEIRRACTCNVSELKKHRRKIKDAEMYVEVVAATQREFQSPHTGTTLPDCEKQIKIGREQQYPQTTNKDAADLLTHAANELGLSFPEQETIKQVAASIARLDCCNSIESRHLCEAIGYRKVRG